MFANQTPFYAESGGQLGDHGEIITEGGATLNITDTLNIVVNLQLHVGTFKKRHHEKSVNAKLILDLETRRALAVKRSATRLLHVVVQGRHLAITWCMKRVVGCDR